MTETKNPLNAPASESIENGKLSISKLGASGAKFRFWSDNPEVHIGNAWIGEASEPKIEQKPGKPNEFILTVSKPTVESWLGLDLYAQCNATLHDTDLTSPKTFFTVVS
ncbi:hypothetical protein EJA70_28790 [Pseudomonas sp. PB103]|jgi:hypothetical protein|uniref:hypothetical protein n=1 Tax=Pseudomonas sp. PB103 TaxID=2494698 RepID=UPI00131E5359|nr:hypothetical protein [Pseudomonas sp. PB103]KAE9639303.1 hypothetical protein EJA70_28790 [Pseudomonas sp. PB103]